MCTMPILYNGSEVVTAVSKPGVYDVLKYELRISAAPWLGHLVWRAVPVEIIRGLVGGGAGLGWFLAASSALVAQVGWFYWYFAGVALFFHLYTRRLFVALQIVFIVALYLGMPQC